MNVKLFRKLFPRKLIRRKYSNIECGGMTTISGTNYCLNLGIGNFTMIYLSYAINLRCSTIKTLFNFDEDPLSNEESEFPLAYGIIVYKNVMQAKLK